MFLPLSARSKIQALHRCILTQRQKFWPRYLLPRKVTGLI